VNKRILGLLVIVIVVVAVAVAVWQMTPAPSAEARNIKIGIVAGMQTVEGQDIERAAKLAIDEINAAGGVWVEEWHTKVKIDFVLVDTADDLPGSTAAPVTRAITDDKVDLLIGGATTGGTLNGQIPAINNRVPFIIVGASLNLVTRRGSLPSDNALYINNTEGMSYMFHYCTTISDYSKTVTHFLADSVKPKLDSTYSFDSSRKLRLAVIHRDDGYGRGVRDVTQSIINDDSLPIEVVGTAAYAASATTYQSQLISIKEANPDAAEIINEGINDVGLKSIYIAVEICEDPQFYELLGETGSNQLLESKVATQWQGDTWYLPKVGTYVENYKNKWDGKISGMMGVDTYDSIYIAKNAIERAGTLNKTNVKNALETTDMPQSLLIMENEKITFSAGTNYHEILPKTFIEQLIWDSASGELKPFVVYPDTMPGISSFKQRDFVLPEDYEPGS
jgi:branched-chain amino acid transport system substrate-binding protein